jgi:two-component system, NarL family, response regulator YdfI
VIRVFIVAASRLTRSRLQNLLADHDVEVIGSGTVDSLAREFADIETDAILIDASGEQYEVVLESVAESELASEAAVVLLTDHAPRGSPVDAFREGVRAVLPSDASADQLVAALQAAAAGLFVVRASDMQAALPTIPATQSIDELAEPLTRREREVLQLLAAGSGNKEIAARLGISDHTVKFHVASILGKLGAESRTEAVSLGIRRGLVLL